MADRIEFPAQPAGKAEEQLQQMYSYLYRLATTLNINLANAGSEAVALTDQEQRLMNQLSANTQTESGVMTSMKEAETLKSLIIKTATFVKSAIDEYKMVLFGDMEMDSQFGNLRQKKGLRVDITPDGIKQSFSFAEIIKGLKTYEINSKNYIKTGYLRTENSLPVYGVQIGRDIVTFAEDGTEIYNDANKVAELTADVLTFFSNGVKTASYSGSELAFFCNNVKKLSITENGVTFLNGTTKLAELLNNALKFYSAGTLRTQMDNDGVKLMKDENTTLAEFLSTALMFYYNGTLRTQINSSGVSLMDGNTKLADFLSTALTFYLAGAKRTAIDTNGIGFYTGETGNEVLKLLIGASGISAKDDMTLDSGKKINLSASGASAEIGGQQIKLQSGATIILIDPTQLNMNTSGLVVLKGNSQSLIELKDELATIFNVDAANGITGQRMTLDDIRSGSGQIDTMQIGTLNVSKLIADNIVYSQTRPASGNNTIWLEPIMGSGSGDPFSGSRSVNAAAAHACAASGFTFYYTVGLSANLDLTDVTSLSFNGSMHRNGSDQYGLFTVTAVINCSDGTTISLGQVGNGVLFGDYSLSGSVSHDGSAKIATGITYTLQTTQDGNGHYSYFNAGTLSYSGTHSGSTPTDECTVHFIP